MEIKKILTYTNTGLQAHKITIEADANNALPTIEIIGLPDVTIKEAKERIRAAFRNVGVQLPPKKIIINLSPSDLRKVGTRFDLPIAIALLALFVSGNISREHEHIIASSVFFGELGLDGQIKPVVGLLPSVLGAIQQGVDTFFIPEQNVKEISMLPDITIYPLTHFVQCVDLIQEGRFPEPIYGEIQLLGKSEYLPEVDFGDIRGHTYIKRALTIAAAGMHNVLLVGPPGSGKTMLAKSLLGILPPMKYEEQLEVRMLYSLIGKAEAYNFCTQRPFRMVHHTASKIAIVGGGQLLTPGEVSLAHRGVLFLDELPEFPREVLEVLRQPIEDKKITISRAHGSVEYPADSMLVAAMNPCPCGFYQDKEKPCTCTYRDIQKYQTKISGPLLDRFDMIIEVPREQIRTIIDTSVQERSVDIQKIVFIAHERQQKRFGNLPYTTNAQIQAKDIATCIPLDDETRTFLLRAIEHMHLSPRVVHRIQKIARTIADVSCSEQISSVHIAEALQYRAKSYFV